MAGRLHLAIYGTVALQRTFCDRCDSFTIVSKGVKECCSEAIKDEEKPTEVIRMVDAPIGRKALSRAQRKALIEGQDNKCFYCFRTFHAFVYQKWKVIRLTIHLDHYVPYDFSRNNSYKNMVAACCVCNLIKHDKVFDSIDEAREVINARWQEKGYSDTPLF